MVQGLESFHVTDGEPVASADARAVLSDAELVYDDGAIQQFMADGSTVYVEGENRKVLDQVAVGLTFASHRDNSVFSGTFRAPARETNAP